MTLTNVRCLKWSPVFPTSKKAGIEHDIINGPGGELKFVEVELKHRPG